MVENIRLALRGIWSHKLRSILTMLGVIIGIASIIAIVSIVEGTNKRLETSLIGAGNNVTTVSVASNGDSWAADFSYSSVPSGFPTISDEIMDGMVSQVTEEGYNVLGATAYHYRQSWGEDVYYLNNVASNVNIYGTDSKFLDMMNYHLTNGRLITEDEYEEGKKVCMVDTTIVSNVFSGENPIGKVLEIKQEPFIVVGVYATKEGSGEAEYEDINDYYTQQYSSEGGAGIIIPDMNWPIIFQYDEPKTIGLRMESADEMAGAGNSAASYLNMYVTNSEYSYAAINSAESTDALNELTSAIELMLVAIASLSLLVGGIGVMNIMLVSVTERTAEIGLKKALGAKRSNIMAQFLTEAAVLTSTGGLIGVLAGIGLGWIISYASGLDFGISVPWILISVGFSVLIGIIFGAMPASRASKLNPIDALRRE